MLTIWTSLDLRRRIFVVAATLAMFAAVLGVSRIAGQPDMVLLYAGMEPATSGEVIASLDQRGVKYQVSGDSIYVDVTQRDSLRMALAAEGLPRAGGGGYELLDALSGFGTTSQMFDAAYWRAKEGELARTLLAMPEIRAARVHIARTPARTFQTEEKATASVTLTTVSGRLDESQARSVRHLVASAVSNMHPDDVQVIDTVAGLIGGKEDNGFSSTNADAKAAAIKNNVERLLAARVGSGKAVVEVSVDLESDHETITEHTFDPQGRVAISTETEDKSGSSTDPGGQVTVASNLPQGDAAAGGSGQSQTTETRERVNYEVSETQREVLRMPGALRRLSVAVLVDGETQIAADGTRSWTPRADAELATLRELVASAVGLDEKRGDVLTLKSLEFQPVLSEGTEATSRLFPPVGSFDAMSLVQLFVLAFVALVLGVFVVRPILTSRNALPRGLPPVGPSLALPGSFAASSVALNGEIDGDYDIPGMNRPRSLPDPDAEHAPDNDPASRLRRLIEKRQTESIEILRGWMENEEERA